MPLTDYTDQQSRFDRAFSCGGSSTCVTCEKCGRTYFVTSQGHGDYDEGELAELRRKADAEPDKYIEVPDYSYVGSADLFGKHVVIGCLCDPTMRVTTWIEDNADELTTYLRLYWEAVKSKAKRQSEDAENALNELNTKGEL